MLTLLIAASLGAYLSRRLNVMSDNGLSDVAISHQRVWQDMIALFALIGFVAGWLINAGRTARTYCDVALLPWLMQHGISITLPTIALPTMPSQELS
ncbi:MAG: hypothetical protein KME18_26590 [Phormidium tanganyikae FI6-MK23]|jgi:hypothetical protein|nr:hypothetical protein [Phormidium tanganyikae FI6-MK23]